MERQRKLPPLGALRAFEAAARLGGFTKAAAELHVTQTAISHQVRSLEEFYGQKLFDRQKREVVLNTAGSALAVVLTDVFDQLEQASHALLSVAAMPLRITVPPAFGSYWLAPRLSRFWAQHTVELNLIPSADRLDFRAGNIDIGIRCGRAPWAGLVSERLMTYSAVPVCSPDYLAQSPPLSVAADLDNHQLIHEMGYQPWAEWFASHEHSPKNAKQGMLSQGSALVYDLVLKGQGVALLSVELVKEHLDSGALLAPLGTEANRELGFYLVYREGALNDLNTSLFRSFLLQEIRGGCD